MSEKLWSYVRPGAHHCSAGHQLCAQGSGGTGARQAGQRLWPAARELRRGARALAKLLSSVLCPWSRLVATAASEHVYQAAGGTTAAGTRVLLDLKIQLKFCSWDTYCKKVSFKGFFTIGKQFLVNCNSVPAPRGTRISGACMQHSQVSWKGRRELSGAKGNSFGSSAGWKPTTGVYKSPCFTRELLLLGSEETKYPGGEENLTFWKFSWFHPRTSPAPVSARGNKHMAWIWEYKRCVIVRKSRRKIKQVDSSHPVP